MPINIEEPRKPATFQIQSVRTSRCSPCAAFGCGTSVCALAVDMGSGKMGKKDDDSEAQTSSVNSLNKDGQMNLVMVGGIFMIVLAMIGWLMNERSALQQETVSLHNELEGYSNDKVRAYVGLFRYQMLGKICAVFVYVFAMHGFTLTAPVENTI